MNGKSAHVVFADPPYNLKIDGHVCGNGSIKHDEFAMASGEMNEAEFTRFLSDCMAPLVTATKKGSIHFLCMDSRHMKEMLNAGEENYTNCLICASMLRTTAVWIVLPVASRARLRVQQRGGSSPQQRPALVATAGIEQTSGSTPVSTRCPSRGKKAICWRCIRPSNRLRWWPMRCLIVRPRKTSFLIRSLVLARLLSLPKNRTGSATVLNSVQYTLTSRFDVGRRLPVERQSILARGDHSPKVQSSRR